MTGVHRAVAEIGIARKSATALGRPLLCKMMEIFGDRRRIPAVAATESAKPASRAWNGSSSTSVPIAKPSDANGSDSDPRALAINKTAVITLARKTEGDGLTRKMNPIRTSAVTIIRTRLLRNIHCESHNIVAAMMAKFSPLTAVK
ncbi:unannotated protein [freshwater metagenome]|uniref:Unannotated protein n=1 Tax=freshwater metagenome TaxID=449393 RepID=A0A6J7L001_9ZZZZ